MHLFLVANLVTMPLNDPQNPICAQWRVCYCRRQITSLTQHCAVPLGPSAVLQEAGGVYLGRPPLRLLQHRCGVGRPRGLWVSGFCRLICLRAYTVDSFLLDSDLDYLAVLKLETFDGGELSVGRNPMRNSVVASEPS